MFIMARYKKNEKTGLYSTTVATLSGKRKHITAKTISELENKKRMYLTGEMVGDTELFSDYAKRWFTTYKKTVSLGTKTMYARILDDHIIPDLGDMRLSDIRPIHVQDFLNTLADRPRTAQIALITLRQISRAAKRDHLIRDDFTDGLKQAKVPRKTKKRALLPDEVEALKKADFPVREKAFVYLIYGTGMRRGEALGLYVSDFDLKAHTVMVSHSLLFDDNDGILQDAPKTENGFRTLPVPDAVWPAVIAYISQRVQDDGLNAVLFPGRMSKHITKSMYDKMWARIIAAMRAAGADCTGLTAHIFRHNYATKLYYSGLTLKKAVALMGHADEKMLLDIYAHIEEDQEQTADRLNNILAL